MVPGIKNEQLLKNVQPQEVNSLVQSPISDDSAYLDCENDLRSIGERHSLYKCLR